MRKLSEQLQKANVANIVNKAKGGKTLNNAELRAVEEYENEQAASENTGLYIVGYKEAAQFFGVTERSFFRWVDAGMPKENRGTYDLKKCFDWYKRNVIETNSSTGKEKEVRLKYWEAKAENEAIKSEKIKGELISLEDVKIDFCRRQQDLKISLMSLNRRLATECEGKNRDEIFQLIKRETDLMLDGFVAAKRLLYLGKAKAKKQTKTTKTKAKK